MAAREELSRLCILYEAMGDPSIDLKHIGADYQITMKSLAAELDALRAEKARADLLDKIFGELCDALGCEHDNEAALEMIAALEAVAEAARHMLGETGLARRDIDLVPVRFSRLEAVARALAALDREVERG